MCKNCKGGAVFSLCCLATGIISLLIIVLSASATVLHPLYFAQTNVSVVNNGANEVLFFGTLGYCHGVKAESNNGSDFNGTCSTPALGYAIDTSEILTQVWWSSITKVISWLIPLALLTAFLAFAFGSFGVVTAAVYLSLIGLSSTIVGGVSLTIFIAKNKNWGLGPGFAFVVYAIFALAIGFITFAEGDFNNPKAKKDETEKGGREPRDPRDDEEDLAQTQGVSMGVGMSG